MEKRVATESSLARELSDYERQFGISSVKFYRLHCAGEAPSHVPPFERVVWADTCRRWERARARNRPHPTAQ